MKRNMSLVTYKNLATLFQHRVYRDGSRVGLIATSPSGRQRFTWEELGIRVRNIGRSLATLQLEPGDRVGILSNESFDASLAELALLSLGATVVPIDPQSNPSTLEFILRHSSARMVLCHGPSLIEKAASLRGRLPELRQVVSLGPAAGATEDPSVPSLDLLGNKTRAENYVRFYERLEKIGQDHPAFIHYRADRRGVVLSHSNLLTMFEALAPRVEISTSDRHLSLLPYHDLVERTVGFHFIIFAGVCAMYPQNAANVHDEFAKELPTFVIGTPARFSRLAEDLRERWTRSSRMLKSFLKRGDLKSNPSQATNSLARPFIAFSDRMALSKAQETFGKDLRLMLSYGGPSDSGASRFFRELGLNVLDGWFLPEAGGVVTSDRAVPSSVIKGTGVLAHLEVRIDASHKIQLRGPSIMQGYYGDREATLRAIDSGGFLQTNQNGVLDSQGLLRFPVSSEKVASPSLDEQIGI